VRLSFPLTLLLGVNRKQASSYEDLREQLFSSDTDPASNLVMAPLESALLSLA
jgi:hypothetical protein